MMGFVCVSDEWGGGTRVGLERVAYADKMRGAAEFVGVYLSSVCVRVL